MVLSACAPSVTIKEKTFYGSLQDDGAAVFHVFSPDTASIDWPTYVEMWNDPTDPLISMHASDFAESKKEYEDLCALYKHCDQPAAEKLNAFFGRLEEFAQKSKNRTALKCERAFAGANYGTCL